MPLPRRVVRYHQLTAESAVLVVSIDRGSPAERAGLQERDAIVALNGYSVAGIDDLHRHLTDKELGVRSEITVIRRADKLVLDIVPTEAPGR